jgi:hypothetical protein
VAALLAFAAWGETLGTVQVAGAGVGIVAVAVLQTRAGRRRRRVAIPGRVTTGRTTA